jgi:ABC-type Zn uptake system ZnuABC Zn-binding protein ZnuA
VRLKWPWLLVALALAAAACAPDPAATEAPRTPPDASTPPPDADAAPPADPPSPGQASPPAAAEPALSVVATVAPLADLVAQVGGERVAVTPLIPPAADSHTYEPRPGDIAVLERADAYVGIGLGLNDGVLGLAEEHLRAGSRLVRLGEEALAPDQLVYDHDHSHDDRHRHDGAGPNPHVWLSVRLARDLVAGITTTLSALEPAEADGYEQRANAYRDELRALDEAIAADVATIPDGDRTLVTYHDAWSYFARDYDLELVTVVQPADFSEPTAAEVRAIIDRMREHDVPALYGSEVFPSDVLDAIAEETGATYVGALADDVLPGRPGTPEHTYVELMRRNASLVVEGLGGTPRALSALE